MNHCSKCCMCSHNSPVVMTPHFTVSTACKLQSWGMNTDLTPQSLLYHQETIRSLYWSVCARVCGSIYPSRRQKQNKKLVSLRTSVASHKLKADHRIFIRIPLETLTHRFPNHYPPQVGRDSLGRLQECLIYYENKLEKGS